MELPEKKKQKDSHSYLESHVRPLKIEAIISFKK